MSVSRRAPESAAPADAPSNALEVRAFAWYLGAVLVGAALLWAVVPSLIPTVSGVAGALLPTVLAFEAVSLAVLWRRPRWLHAVRVAQFASFFPILLGFLAAAIGEAVGPGARHLAIAGFAVWVPVVVVFAFYVFGSRDGLVAALAFVASAASVVAVAATLGATLDGPGIAYVAVLFVASVALAVLVYGTSQNAERLAAARIEAAVAVQLALRDALTGVHSRFALEERFDQELARVRRGGRPLAVYFLDLDGFKRVNDAHGHATGDALLAAFAARIQGSLRGFDTMGRMGGDEFVVLATVADRQEAQKLAERMLAACVAPVVVDGVAVALAVSIGVAMHPGDGADRPALLRAADPAMYAAKAAGPNRWAAHSGRDGAPASDRAVVGDRPQVGGARRTSTACLGFC